MITKEKTILWQDYLIWSTVKEDVYTVGYFETQTAIYYRPGEILFTGARKVIAERFTLDDMPWVFV